MAAPATTKKTKRRTCYKYFFFLSLFHAIFTSGVFLAVVALFSVYSGNVMQFWNRYRTEPGDVRAVFNPAAVAGGWAIVVTFAVWDYCALGGVVAASEHRRLGDDFRRQLPCFWCCQNSDASERLTDACHGCCDHAAGRLIIIAIRTGVISALLTVAGMTALAGWHLNEIPKDEKPVYMMAVVVSVAMLIEMPLTLAASILHSIYTYHWIKNWHQIEVMAFTTGGLDDSLTSQKIDD